MSKRKWIAVEALLTMLPPCATGPDSGDLQLVIRDADISGQYNHDAGCRAVR